MRRLASLVLLLAWLAPHASAVSAQDGGPLPIVDTHVHYNRESWRAFPPEDALALLDEAGVGWALVSSTPDDGTLQLWSLAPHRIVPMLRPYRAASDFETWTSDGEVLAEIEARLQSGVPYRGIGEFELAPEQAWHPVPLRLTEIAAERGLWLHAHAEPTALRELASVRDDVRVLWAHAGVTASAATVSETLALHPNVWVELSLRGSDIAPPPDARLDADWAELFVRYPERIVLGSDTWLPRDWAVLPHTHAAARGWLGQLPAEVAYRIAVGNAHALFGAAAAAELTPAGLRARRQPPLTCGRRHHSRDAWPSPE
jgi:hypothetical protein